MNIKFILPALTESESPFWRPIKYSLFPPLGLATLAGYLSSEDEAQIVDQHVQKLTLEDSPDVVAIQVYITNAYRAYAIADAYRAKGVFVLFGGLHVTSLPEEAEKHADAIILGPAEESFPRFLSDFRKGNPARRYGSQARTLVGVPPIRRDLLDRRLYLVPNSIVVSRGCPHHCSFCYKDAFYQGENHSTPRLLTTPWLKSIGCPEDTCISWMTTCSGTGGLPPACSRACGAWAGYSKVRPPWTPSWREI